MMLFLILSREKNPGASAGILELNNLIAYFSAL